MNLQNTLDDVKSRAQQLRERGQNVANASRDSLKQANQIVVDRTQSLFGDHKATSKALFESAKSGFAKARADGVKAVLAAPAGYLPPRDKWENLLNDTRATFKVARSELSQVAQDGYNAATGKSAPAKAKKVARKATTKAKKTAKKASARVSKAAKEASAKLDA
ncbi:MAG: hypothetical protein L0H70_10000 [Xanthomonadales bacterium]|nr:hypothetical protein [Xanthomonadales bacterium]